MSEKESTGQNSMSTLDLPQNVAGLLCYVGFWISGLVFLVLERENHTVRFHAGQSVVLFGILFILQIVLQTIPLVGSYLGMIAGIVALVFWIILMVSAVSGNVLRLPVVEVAAEKLAQSFKVSQTSGAVNEKVEVEPTAPVKEEKIAQKAKVSEKQHDPWLSDYFKSSRTGRIVSSSFAIFWSFVFLIFLNFYNQYIAFYSFNVRHGVTEWTMHPILTPGFDLWLPVINFALALSIAGHILLIVNDNFIVHDLMHIVLPIAYIIAFWRLLEIFPFDFYTFAGWQAAQGLELIARIIIVIVLVALVIAVVINLVKFVITMIQVGFRRAD